MTYKTELGLNNKQVYGERKSGFFLPQATLWNINCLKLAVLFLVCTQHAFKDIRPEENRLFLRCH